MREIDNNLTNVNFKSVQPLPAVEDSTNSAKKETAFAEQKEIKDLKNMPAAELGKSQVASDSLETDLKFLEKHPELVKELNLPLIVIFVNEVDLAFVLNHQVWHVQDLVENYILK